MKFFNLMLGTFVCVALLPGVCLAEKSLFYDNIHRKIHQRQAISLRATNSFKTPRIIELVKDGSDETIRALKQGAQHEKNGEFLLLTDNNDNNVFHVAKNVQTVQVLAGLFRKFYGAKASQQLSTLINNKRNKFGETPLMAQINAAHADTFKPLYNFSLLKQKNDIARYQLAGQQGMLPKIQNQNKSFYCKEIRQLASSNGITLLQAAQIQAAYHTNRPELLNLVQEIAHKIPCLVNN